MQTDADEESQLRRKLVGSYIQKMRNKAGLTQRTVSDAMHYTSSQFVSNWERGLALPPLDALPVLARLFGVSPREVIDVMMDYQTELLKLTRRRMTRVFRTGSK